MNYSYLGWLIVQVIIAVLLLVHNKGNWGTRKKLQFALVVLCIIVTIVCMFFDVPMWIPVSLFVALAIVDLVLERESKRT